MTIGMMRMAGTPYLNFLMVEVYAANLRFAAAKILKKNGYRNK